LEWVSQLRKATNSHISWRYTESWIVDFEFSLNKSLELDIRLYEQKPGGAFQPLPAWIVRATVGEVDKRNCLR
jgi:hypothetical protein